MRRLVRKSFIPAMAFCAGCACMLLFASPPRPSGESDLQLDGDHPRIVRSQDLLPSPMERAMRAELSDQQLEGDKPLIILAHDVPKRPAKKAELSDQQLEGDNSPIILAHDVPERPAKKAELSKQKLEGDNSPIILVHDVPKRPAKNKAAESEFDTAWKKQNIINREPLKWPPIKDTLMKTEFGKNWTEDFKLKDLRKYGLFEEIPESSVLNKLTQAQLSAMLHSYLDNSNFLCKRKLRLGLVGDNGWEVCDDTQWRPVHPCIIYSFGINYDFSFDDDAGRIYGCDVYSFDPSMAKQPTYRRSDRVMFYRLGVGGQSGEPIRMQNGWVLHSFSNFRRMLNHSDKIIDVVKMDVERYEWKTLETMIQERQLHNVRQLLVEYHVYARHMSGLRSHLNLLRNLESLGFKKFYITKNGSDGCVRSVEGFPVLRTKCYEVHYVNVNFRRG